MSLGDETPFKLDKQTIDIILIICFDNINGRDRF
jgi:hypothetical protein